jgi:hypothetical protein
MWEKRRGKEMPNKRSFTIGQWLGSLPSLPKYLEKDGLILAE